MCVAIVLLFPTLLPAVYGQHLHIRADAESREIIDQYPLSVRQVDSSGIQQSIERLIGHLQMDGYFLATVDTLRHTDSLRWEVAVRPGKRFEWLRLSPGNLNPLLQQRSGFRERFFLNRPFSYTDIREMAERVLVAAENEGYPFASLKLKDIQIERNTLSAALDYRPGPVIRFGRLKISGTDKVKPDFLASLLKIPEGSPYSEKRLKQVPDILADLPYLSLEGSQLHFQNDVAELNLALSERNSNQLDALINFLPNENEPGKLLLTGRAEILLNNLMRSGKQLRLEWQRLQTASQQLMLAYRHPYLLRTPLRAELSFSLLKEDTLFINRDLSLGFSYPLAHGNRLSLATRWRNSNLLSDEVLSNEPQTRADFSLLSWRLGWQLRQLDRSYQPRRGVSAALYAEMGRKNIRSSSILPGEVSQGVLWQPAIEFELRQYRPLGRSWQIYHRLGAAWTDADRLFINDLYRLGGMASLRGFNDNFFFASAYALSQLELRLIVEENEQGNSFLYIFYDQAWLSERVGTEVRDVPMGLGAGLSLNTGAGNFSIAYALGRQKATKLDFSRSRIHFGYVSRF
jgi:outer membrane protein assembly factor BamA